MLIFIFLLAFIFHLISLDEEYRENDLNNDNVSEIKADTNNNKILPGKKQKNLLEIDDEYEYSNEIINNTENNNTINDKDEKQIHDIIDYNYKAHWINQFASIDSNSKVEIPNLNSEQVEELRTRLNNFIYNFNNDNKVDTNNNTDSETSSDIVIVSKMFTDNSPVDSEFSRIVSLIREGEDIVIYSPKSVEDTDKDYLDKSVYNKEKVGEVSYSYKVEPTKPPIIITRRVADGEPVPAIPNWINFGFYHEDYSIKRDRMDRLFNTDYENTHIDDTKPKYHNQRWLEDTDSYHIDKLFDENNSDNISSKKKD